MSDRPPKSGPQVGFDFTQLPRPVAPPPAQVERAKPPEPEVFTVGQLGRILGRSIEREFSDALWVEGEVSSARPAASGHLYFCLKDEQEEAVVDVVIYRTNVT